MRAFVGLTRVTGYGSKKQVAARRALFMYESLCSVKPDADIAFWQQECHMPPTFQSWFTVTNLHVWLLTVRLRALPESESRNHIQGLIDHFFLDVEERVRAVLQPNNRRSRSTRPKPTSAFYKNPNAPDANGHIEETTPSTGKKRPKGNAPERIVTRQMKIFKEQWAGLGMSFDLALGTPTHSDVEMAGAIWRNFLGGRGARGIVYPDSPNADQYFRRSINLVGGQVESVKKLDNVGLEVEEKRDDGSGVHDYSPEDADKYVAYPELMETLVSYVRRELVRLERLSDDEITGSGGIGREGEGVDRLSFGRIKL